MKRGGVNLINRKLVRFVYCDRNAIETARTCQNQKILTLHGTSLHQNTRSLRSTLYRRDRTPAITRLM